MRRAGRSSARWTAWKATGSSSPARIVPDGQHHLIPVAWVAKVHDHIHLNKDHAEVQARWQPA